MPSRLPTRRRRYLCGGHFALGAARATAAASEDVIEGDGAGSEKDQGESQSCKCKRELEAGMIGRSHQSVVPVRFRDCHQKIDAESDGSGTREESHENEQPSEKLGHGRNVAQPSRYAQAGDEVHVVMQVTKQILITVCQHDGAQREAHHNEGEWLRAIEVAQRRSPDEADSLPQAKSSRKLSMR